MSSVFCFQNSEAVFNVYNLAASTFKHLDKACGVHFQLFLQRIEAYIHVSKVFVDIGELLINVGELPINVGELPINDIELPINDVEPEIDL